MAAEISKLLTVGAYRAPLRWPGLADKVLQIAGRDSKLPDFALLPKLFGWYVIDFEQKPPCVTRAENN